MRTQNLSKFINASVTALFAAMAFFIVQDMHGGNGHNGDSNGPVMHEASNDIPADFDTRAVTDIEDRIKQAIETGNRKDAERIQRELEMKKAPGREISAQPVTEFEFDNSRSNEEVTDWAQGAPAILNGELNDGLAQYHRQIDMKKGEDGNIYVATNRAPASNWSSRIDVYRSSNNGRSWIVCGSVLSNQVYTYSIAMTVESRVNSVPDSTRINLFYTVSTSSFNNDADLNLISFRRNGTAHYIAGIAQNTPGYSIHSLSAVSDGAFWSSSTFFGVVYCESDLNNPLGPTRIRFMRTVNWGITFVSAEYQTLYADYYPSAQFFNGATDEVWIALERRFSSNEKQIRVIKSTWTPDPNFSTMYVTSGSSYLYEKPCLSVKQNNPCDTAVVTSTRNKLPVYNHTTAGGANWSTSLALTSSASANKSYTWCSSTPNGSAPFTFLYSTDNGAEISIREGAAGNLSPNIQQTVNTLACSPAISPVCITDETAEGSLSAIAYAGTGGTNAYFDSEGHKFINIKLALQGPYNPAGNNLSVQEGVSIVLKKAAPPYITVDSAAAILDPSSLNTSETYPQLSTVKMNYLQSNGSYYVVIRHRNSIETWSSAAVSSVSDTISYDFTKSISRAYGNNLALVDTQPVVHALYSGDVNQDGTVDVSDLAAVDNDVMNFTTGYEVTDLNGDAIVDAIDAMICDNNAFLFVSSVRP